MKWTAACALLAAILCVGGAQAKNAVIRASSSSRQLGENPWLVHLRLAVATSGYLNSCIGNLIDLNWVLTTATCTDGASLIWLRFGVVNVINPELVTEVGVGNVINNPLHIGPLNNVALIKTTDDIQPTDNIRPIRFQKLAVIFPLGETFETCFWGLNSDRTAPSEELRCAYMLKVEPLLQCAIPSLLFPLTNLICAVGPANCDSDQGAPLTIEEEDGPTLIGLLNYGPPQSCETVQTDQDVAIAYTRVSAYTAWITLVMSTFDASDENNSEAS